MLLEDFTTFLRSQVRNFDKDQRAANREDGDEIAPLSMSLEDWIEAFKEYV